VQLGLGKIVQVVDHLKLSYSIRLVDEGLVISQSLIFFIMPNFMKYLLLFTTSILFFHCTEKKADYVIDSKWGKEMKLTLDSITIDVDSLSMNPLFIYDNFTDKENSENILVGYNENTHSLDFLRLGNKSLLKRLFLVKDGIGAMNDVLSIDLYNWDSIFVYSRAQLRIIDTAGVVKAKYNLLGDGIVDNFGEPVADFYFKLEYFPKRKSVLFYNVIDPPSLRSSKYIISEFSLPEGIMTTLPIKYSNYFTDNNARLGHLAYLSKEHSFDKKLIYNFLYESNIYVYDFSSEEITVYGGKSETAKPLATLFDIYNNQDNFDWQRHAIENPHYFQVLPDRFRNLYYRLHWLPASTASSTMPTAKDKDLVLMVFDSNFNIVYEMQLPSKTYRIHHWFVTKDGLFLSPTHPDRVRSEDINVWHIFKFGN
jgi:hypothetical protein